MENSRRGKRLRFSLTMGCRLEKLVDRLHLLLASADPADPPLVRPVNYSGSLLSIRFSSILSRAFVPGTPQTSGEGGGGKSSAIFCTHLLLWGVSKPTPETLLESCFEAAAAPKPVTTLRWHIRCDSSCRPAPCPFC